MLMDSKFVINGAEGRFTSKIKASSIFPLGPTLHFHFIVDQIRLRIRLFFLPMQHQLNITKFQLQEFKGVDVTLSGMGPFNPILEKMITITSDILENLVIKYIGETIEQFTQSTIYQVPMMQW